MAARKGLRPISNLDEVWLAEIARLLQRFWLTPTPPITGPLTEGGNARACLKRWHAPCSIGRPCALAAVSGRFAVVRPGDARLAWLPAPVRRPSAVANPRCRSQIRNRSNSPAHGILLALTRSGLLSEIPWRRSTRPRPGCWPRMSPEELWKPTKRSRSFTTAKESSIRVEMVRAGMADEETGNKEMEELVKKESINLFPCPHIPCILRLPRSAITKVRAVIQWRLAQLSPETQALAQTAAVIGRKFSFKVLARPAARTRKQWWRIGRIVATPPGARAKRLYLRLHPRRNQSCSL